MTRTTMPTNLYDIPFTPVCQHNVFVQETNTQIVTYCTFCGKIFNVVAVKKVNK